MLLHRPAAQRGTTELGWLHSWHTFSFGGYRDPEWQGFRSLVVINDDIIEPGGGFGLHGHRDMEIITWVLSGALEHRDSIGGGGVLRPGDVQVMTAGTGIRHSEMNASTSAAVHLLQMWILPDRDGEPPAYAQAAIAPAERRGRWAVLAAGGGRPAAVRIAADAAVSTAQLPAGGRLGLAPAAGRHAWLHVARGGVRAGDLALAAGDGLGTDAGLELVADEDAEMLWFDLP